jgi:hypothetical protein
MSRWRERLAPDPHVADREEPIYRVHSVYFDTPKRDALRKTGFPKHRLRRYDDSETRYLEEKFSRGRAVWKRRVQCTDNDLHYVEIDSSNALPSDPRIAWFSHRFRTLQLAPLVEISYDRYALVGEDGLRITCDFSAGARYTGSTSVSCLPLLDEEAILEIKSAGAPGSNGVVTEPILKDLAREAVSFSKYAQGIRRLEVGSPVSWKTSPTQ